MVKRSIWIVAVVFYASSPATTHAQFGEKPSAAQPEPPKVSVHDVTRLANRLQRDPATIREGDKRMSLGEAVSQIGDVVQNHLKGQSSKPKRPESTPMGGMGGGMGMGMGMGMDMGGMGGSATLSPTSSDGDGFGVIVHGSHLIIRGPQSIQDQVEELLTQLREATGDPLRSAITVEVAIVHGGIEAVESVKDPIKIAKLVQSPDTRHMLLRCRDGVPASLRTGLTRSFVTSITPVVGGNSDIGYQPQIVEIPLGMSVDMVADLSTATDKAVIDLRIDSTTASDDTQKVQFADGLEVDRPEVRESNIQASLEVAEDRWTIAGVLSGETASRPDEADQHAIVVVRWTR